MTQSSPAVLRPLKVDDLDPLWSIFRGIIAEGATYVQDEDTTQERFRDYWLGRGGETWVAVLAERVVGGYTPRPNQRFRAIQFNFVASTNEAAVKLWQKPGFEVVGTLPGAFLHKRRGYVDTLVMFPNLQ